MFFKKENEYSKYAKEKAQIAVEYAKDFNRDLNYSKDSIRDLEAILDYYHKDIEVSKPTENQIWSMATIFGTYLGETMLKNGLTNEGYDWNLHEEYNSLMLMTKDGSFTSPLEKVYKRLLNGVEDSVISFYDVVTDMIIKGDVDSKEIIDID